MRGISSDQKKDFVINCYLVGELQPTNRVLGTPNSGTCCYSN